MDSKRYIVSNGKDKGIIVFAENGDEALRKGNRSFYGAYPIKEKLTNVQLYQPNKHQFVSSLGNKKFKYVQHHFSGEGVAGNQTIYDTNIDTKLNERQLQFIGDAKIDYIKFYDSEKSKFEEGGWILMEGNTERKIGEYETESEATKMMYEYEGDSVIVEDMEFDVRITQTGLILPNDNGKSSGIRPRWGRVYAVGPEQQDVRVGEWICVAHGRWTRGLDIEDGGMEILEGYSDNYIRVTTPYRAEST